MSVELIQGEYGGLVLHLILLIGLALATCRLILKVLIFLVIVLVKTLRWNLGVVDLLATGTTAAMDDVVRVNLGQVVLCDLCSIRKLRLARVPSMHSNSSQLP